MSGQFYSHWQNKEIRNDTKQGELKENYSQPAIVAFTINT